jgi:glycosyltransferase involved in cell wall biosynthesis
VRDAGMMGDPSPHTTYRVAFVHSFYSSDQPSGENTAVIDQMAALRTAGHDVALVAAHTDTMAAEFGYTLRAGLRVATGRGRSPLAQLRQLAPDVVHVHNLFPNFGTGWLERWPGALVATLHNYRPACAAGTLFRDGKVCEKCPEGDRWAGLRHACYRGTRSATLPLAWANRRGAGHPVLRRADRLIVLSEYSRGFYRRFTKSAEKLELVPNFFDGTQIDSTERSGTEGLEKGRNWVFAGRLSEEKGILSLLRSWPQDEPLDVIGSGPLESACRAAAPRSVRFFGALSRPRLLGRLPHYTGLIFPSVCPENAPVICREALAVGLPVLALSGSAAAEDVLRHSTGAVYSSAEELPHALDVARKLFPTLREHCLYVHASHYTAQSWVAQVEAVFARAVQEAAARQAAARSAAACETHEENSPG